MRKVFEWNASLHVVVLDALRNYFKSGKALFYTD